MKSPGTLLREARKGRGLTLEDMAAMTRVPKAMLHHLEQDRFGEYEAEVFLRGHLRNYARELGLDVSDVIEAYERQTGRRKTDPIEEAQEAGRIKTTTPKPAVAAAGTSGSSGQKAANKARQQFSELADTFGGVRRSHLVAVVLVLVGLFLMFGYISGNQVTAQDAAEFEEPAESDWELEQDVEETRWLLEQSGSGAESE